MSSDDRLAVVTGTSSGIGLVIADGLLAQGWTVRGLDNAAPKLQHGRFVAVDVDLRDGGAVDAAARAASGASAFVHAAGLLRVARAGEFSEGDGEVMWRVHVDAANRLANSLVPAMKRAGRGRIVLVGSRVAAGIAGRSQYAATKAALVSMARSWAAEVVADGVTVNVVSPAATRTAMSDDPARARTAPKVPPIGRLIEPAEIASMVTYLLSPAAAAITGQDIQICGGASLELA